MRKQIRGLIALCMLVAIIVTGCGIERGPSFTIGAWNGNIFENSWLNMRFEVDNYWTIATDEEIAEFSGVGLEMLSELQGTSKESLEAMVDLTTVYGFLVLKGEGDPSIQLIFENLAKTIGGKNISEDEYLDIMLDQLSGMNYEMVEEASKVELANKTFTTLKTSAYDGLVLQDYYCYKQDKYMVTLITSYTEDNESSVQDFINNIAVLN